MPVSSARSTVSPATCLTALAGAAALFLTGCAVTPPESRMAEATGAIPEVWENVRRAGSQENVGDWIAGFRDARLEALVDEALANNPDLRAASARIDQARAQSRAARSARGPAFDLGGNATRQKQNFIGFPIPGADEGSVLSVENPSYGVSLDLAWEVDLWGRVAAGERAAVAAVQAATADAQAARLSLAAQVAKAWFALAEAMEQQEHAEAALASARQTVELIRERFDSGQIDAGASAAQLRLAMSDASGAEADLETTAFLRERAARQLSALLGRYPSDAEKPARLPEPGGPPPAGLPSELLTRRPDLLAAERRFAAQGARQQEAARALFPQFSLTGSRGTSTDSLGEILKSDFGVWRLGANVTQPIWRSGRILAEIDLRDAEEQEAMAALQSAVIQAFLEVETFLAGENRLAQRERSLAEARQLAEEADRAAREEFASGTGDILTVFAAEARLVAARRQFSAARLERLENRINLHLALGGGFRN